MLRFSRVRIWHLRWVRRNSSWGYRVMTCGTCRLSIEIIRLAAICGCWWTWWETSRAALSLRLCQQLVWWWGCADNPQAIEGCISLHRRASGSGVVFIFTVNDCGRWDGPAVCNIFIMIIRALGCWGLVLMVCHYQRYVTPKRISCWKASVPARRSRADYWLRAMRSRRFLEWAGGPQHWRSVWSRRNILLYSCRSLICSFGWCSWFAHHFRWRGIIFSLFTIIISHIILCSYLVCSSSMFGQGRFPAETSIRLSMSRKLVALEFTVPLPTFINGTAVWSLASVDAPVSC